MFLTLSFLNMAQKPVSFFDRLNYASLMIDEEELKQLEEIKIKMHNKKHYLKKSVTGSTKKTLKIKSEKELLIN